MRRSVLKCITNEIAITAFVRREKIALVRFEKGAQG